MTLQEFFTGPEKWTKHHTAITATGDLVDCTDSAAVAFCLGGGILACYGNDQYESIADQILRAIPGGPWITTFNDDPKTTFADIRRVIEAANV